MRNFPISVSLASTTPNSSSSPDLEDLYLRRTKLSSFHGVTHSRLSAITSHQTPAFTFKPLVQLTVCIKMPSLGDVTYSREEYIAEIRDYFHFLKKVYLEESDVEAPPEGMAQHHRRNYARPQ